jgi:hypothetical protein
LDQLVGLVLPVRLVVAREPDVGESVTSEPVNHKLINYSMSSLVSLSDGERASGLPLKLKMHMYGYGLLGAESRREQVELYGFHSRFHLYNFIFLVKKKVLSLHTDN